MSADAGDRRLFGIAEYRAARTGESALQDSKDTFGKLVWDRARAIAGERGETVVTPRMVEDATDQVMLGVAQHSARGRVVALGGVLLGGGLSGLIALIAGTLSLALVIVTMFASVCGVALMCEPSLGLKLFDSARRRGRVSTKHRAPSGGPVPHAEPAPRQL